MFVERRHQQVAYDSKQTECSDSINVEQLAMLHTIESYGWSLKFIRFPHSPSAELIVSNPESSAFGVLEKDGSFNQDPSIQIRG